MEKLVEFIEERPVVAVSALGFVAFCTVRILQAAFGSLFGKFLAELDTRPDRYENGIIYLHIFPRSICRQHLNMTPFVIKLESWLRLHKIPYKAIETLKMSSTTSPIPYIILDGEEIADSNKIMHFLEKKFNLPEDEGLNKEQKAISHSLLRTADESFGWTYGAIRLLHRYDHFFNNFIRIPASRIIKYMSYRQMKSVGKNKIMTHGIGRKTIPDIMEIAKDDISAISNYLGKKKFLMGDVITKVDCAVFSHMCQVIYVDFPYPQKEIIKEEYPNILPYMDRIKEELWPDWDELVTP